MYSMGTQLCACIFNEKPAKDSGNNLLRCRTTLLNTKIGNVSAKFTDGTQSSYFDFVKALGIIRSILYPWKMNNKISILFTNFRFS